MRSQSLINNAATEESTPPLIAINAFINASFVKIRNDFLYVKVELAAGCIRIVITRRNGVPTR